MSPQQLIAHYRIVSKLGEGGMGEVWRATDTKLNRDVAIKILPEAFASDPDRMARFERESKVLASLNHPNIAVIHGVEERALVMELVEGPTLAERIAAGPIPPDDAVPIARQIAEALEYAHEKGVIHRDLKPANIKITPEGRVKVLDFGLAKAMSSDGTAADPVSSPTLTMRATQMGVIVGTAAYMSPEQAKGKPVDRRADIWAFGAVLYEMLTGRELYTGETVSETLAAVLLKEPELSALPSGTPPAVRRLLRRCLDKDPQRRLRDIGEARIVLERAPAEEESSAVAVAGSPRRGVPIRAAALVAAAAALLPAFFLWRATRPADRPMMRFSVDLGPDAVGNVLYDRFVISPDGKRLMFPSRGAGGATMLATRLLDQPKAEVLAGTEDATLPFFKPDSQWIGFFAGGKLKKISVQGGAAVTLCEASGPRGGWWGEDGSIVANLDIYGLYRVPESGGQPEPIGKPLEHGDRTWRWPQILPGGQTVLVTAGTGTGSGYEDANLEAISVKTGQSKIVQRGGYFGRYLPSGHLVYVHQGTLFAAPWDAARLEMKGAPVPILADVAGSATNGLAQLDFSETGTFVYLSGKANAGPLRIAWLDSSGKPQPLLSPPAAAFTPRVSPDGRRLAVCMNGDLSVYDPQRDATTRLSFKPGAGSRYPSWMPDGKHIVFGQILPTPDFALWWVRADGSGQPEKLFSAKEALVPTSISPDGRRIAFGRLDPVTAMDIWTLPLDLSDPDHPKAGQPEPFLRDPLVQWDAAFSPDGRWMAYTSNESGASNVFVRPFPGGTGAGKWQISNGAGRYPNWSRNGRELFYLSLENYRIMMANYTARGDSFAADKPREWSPTRIQLAGNNWPIDLAPDGKRFAAYPADSAPGAGGDEKTAHVTVLLNFFDELRRRLPAK